MSEEIRYICHVVAMLAMPIPVRPILPNASCQSASFINPSMLNVIYAPDAGQLLLIGQAAANCPEGDGWYASTNNEVVLCPKTCATVNANGAASIQMYAGCSGPLIMC